MTERAMEALEAIEGYAVETVEGLIFTVKGLVHPPHRSIAYLRYVPDANGDRRRGSIGYRRVYRFEEQREILCKYPEYIEYDPIFGFEAQGVPIQRRKKIYDPCLRLSGIIERGTDDPLEEKALAFANLLKEISGVPVSCLGVSGSILVGLHRPESDIDLAVFGDGESRAVHSALRKLMVRDGGGSVRRLDTAELSALHASHRDDTPLSFSDFVRLQSRKVNEGFFTGIPFFIRFIKGKGEIVERYGDTCCKLHGNVKIRFRVSDDRDAIFTPCRYGVEDVSFPEGAGEWDVREVVSFRGRFSDQARAGEWAIARGRLEEMIPREGKSHHRLLVGGEAGDYLLSGGESD